MAKPFKIFLFVVIGIILLIAAALIAAATLFDPNDYRGQFQEEVKKETGRDLALGDIKLKVFPWLRVSLADARLGNAPGFGEQPFAEVNNVSVGVKLMPLLFDKQVQVSAVTLEGLHVNLAKNKDGVSNWADLIKHQEEKPKEDNIPKPKAESQFSLENIDIDGVTVEDASVTYDDAQGGKHYELQKLKLSTGSLNPTKPFDVDLSATVVSKTPAAQADIGLSGTIKPDFKAQKLDTDGLKLTVKGKALDYDIDTTLKTRLVADLAAQVFNLNALAVQAKVGGKSIPGGSQDITLSGDLAYNVKEGALRFAGAKLQAVDLIVSTDITGSGLAGEAPKLSGPISVALFSPRKLLEGFGTKLDTADPKALSEASLSAQYSGTLNSASLQNLVVTLDQTKIKGNFGVQDFKTLALAFALQVDSIDADRYLPPKVKTPKDAAQPAEKVETPSGEKKDVNAIELPAQLLQKLNADGTVDIGSLKIDNLKLSDIRLKLSGQGAQAAKQQDVSAKLYGGSVSLTHRFTPGAAPGYALKTQLSSFQAGPFLQDFTGKDYVSGVADFSADVSGRGKTVGDLRRTLDGKLAAQAKNGAVKGFNLGQIIRKGEAMLAGNLNYTETSAPETDFAAISVSGTLNNGVLHSDDLNAASPLFRVGGAGDINLVDETLNYTAKPTIVETSKGQGGKDLSQLGGVTIPIRLSGSLWKPKYKVDIEDAVKQKATEKVKEKLADPEVKQKINDKINDLLFGKKKKQQPTEPQTTP
ncbi:MAG: AsmA family protein [Solimonas sp.]